MEPRARILELLATCGGAGKSRVEVQMLAEQVGDFQLQERLSVPLPATSRRGVVPISLTFSHPEEVAVRRITLKAPKPPGTAEFSEDGLSQSGWSVVQWTLPTHQGSRLVGELLPPRHPNAHQVFAVEIESEHQEVREVFRWDQDAKAVAVNDELPDRGRFVRLRLVALGRGEPGVWKLHLEQKHMPAQDPMPPPRAPKAVVVYVMDALRASALSCYGSREVSTPCFDTLAGQGARFTAHYSVAPSTAPSTRSLFTGLPLQAPKALPEQGPATLAEMFHRAGYVTASFSSNPNLSREFGLMRGFDSVWYKWIDEDFNQGRRSLNTSAAQVHSALRNWLGSLHDEDRVFLYVHTLHPHNPYTPPEGFLGKHLDLASDLPVGTSRELVSIRDREVAATDEIRQRIKGAYLAGVEYNDSLLCDLVATLEERFGGDEVLLIVTSDHGEELFDHGGVLHGYTLYEEMLHIPLVVRWPGTIRPRDIESQTSNLDLFATLCDLIGAASSSATPGNSLWTKILSRRKSAVDETLAFAAAPGIRDTFSMVKSPHLKVVAAQSKGSQSGMGFHLGRSHDNEYVFDLEADPNETVNRCGEDSLQADWLRGELRAWMHRWAQGPDGKPSDMDAVTRRQLEALGYVQP